MTFTKNISPNGERAKKKSVHSVLFNIQQFYTTFFLLAVMYNKEAEDVCMYMDT
jgi:hypothetical protein